MQLRLVLKTLRHPGQFVLCGDANQIVHPSFFWSALKSLFFRQQQNEAAVNILQANYRNGHHVTALANRLLRLKLARFSAIDRESHHFVRSCGQTEGTIRLLEDREATRHELNSKTSRSNRVAVIVMQPEQKAQARRWFSTPLVFSVQEVKGLEYETVILYNMVSSTRKAFDDICEGSIRQILRVRCVMPTPGPAGSFSRNLQVFHQRAVCCAHPCHAQRVPC